jgi:hypothetical protein
MNCGYVCGVTAIWEPRVEAPETLARRLLNLIDRLKSIDPVFAEWYVWTSETTEVPLDQQPEALARKIAETAELDVNGAPVPELGYRYIATNSKTDGPPARIFSLSLQAGGFWRSPMYNNKVRLSTLYDVVPDPHIVTYPIIKQVIIALAECFDALWCSAYSSEIAHLWQNKRGPRFEFAWISYLASRLAQTIQAPSSAIVERLVDGSLLMAATTETFNIANPAHLAVAHEIEAAVAPLRAMPWPPGNSHA